MEEVACMRAWQPAASNTLKFSPFIARTTESAEGKCKYRFCGGEAQQCAVASHFNTAGAKKVPAGLRVRLARSVRVLIAFGRKWFACPGRLANSDFV